MCAGVKSQKEPLSRRSSKDYYASCHRLPTTTYCTLTINRPPCRKGNQPHAPIMILARFQQRGALGLHHCPFYALAAHTLDESSLSRPPIVPLWVSNPHEEPSSITPLLVGQHAPHSIIVPLRLSDPIRPLCLCARGFNSYNGLSIGPNGHNAGTPARVHIMGQTSRAFLPRISPQARS
jgi:hypothetical protein